MLCAKYNCKFNTNGNCNLNNIAIDKSGKCLMKKTVSLLSDCDSDYSPQLIRILPNDKSNSNTEN